MFCSSLRRRPSFQAAIPTLTARGGIELCESSLKTHDICLPLDTTVNRHGIIVPRRNFRLLLFSRSSVSSTKIEGTIERIRRFASLTGGQDLAIVFLLASPTSSQRRPTRGREDSATASTQLALSNGDASTDSSGDMNGMLAYTKLHALLADRVEITYLPLLPLANLEDISKLLQEHVATLKRPQISHKSAMQSSELLQLCTANPPMQRQTAYILSDLFISFRELSNASTGISSAPQFSSSSSFAAVTDTTRAGRDADTGQGRLVNEPMTGTQLSSSIAAAESGSRKLERLQDLVGEQQCLDVVDFWRDEWMVE